MLQQPLHAAGRGPGVWGMWDLLHFLSVKEKRRTVKPLELLWQISPRKESKSAGSSVFPPAGNGCVFKCSLCSCDQVPQGHSLENAFHHRTYDVTQRFLTKPSRGLSVMK